jgi:hypothetical protein
MAKSTPYLHDEDDTDFFANDDFDSSVNAESTRKREQKAPTRHPARQRLDSRQEELWLKQQLNDWDDEF